MTSRPRKAKPSCSRLRCQRPPARGTELCLTHCKQEADRLFSLYIRARDGKCMDCGTTENLQSAHLLTRSYIATRWDPDNAVALCREAHVRWTHRPLEWEAWVDSCWPDMRQRLRAKALTHARPDYAVLLPELRALLKEVSS